MILITFAYKTKGVNRTKIMPLYSFVFTGKERDSETGYSYFGARYYDSGIPNIFLSVDPMTDKYPSISPYAYCAWNPVKLVDPDGNKIVLTGDDECVSEAMRQMQQKTSNLKFHINNDGVISYSGKAKTKAEKYMARIIEDEDVVVNLKAQNHSNNNGKTFDFGAFDGNTLSDDETHIEANQIINVIKSRETDKKCKDPGNAVWHEIAEAYEGGLLSKTYRIGIPASGSDPKEYYFNLAHSSAGRFFPGNVGSRISNIDYPEPLKKSIMLSNLFKNNQLSKPLLFLPETRKTYFYHR